MPVDSSCSHPRPTRHLVSADRAEQWIVTCADSNVYDELLVPFLGSLLSLARWTGQVVIFDYGLAPTQAARLSEFGLTVEPIPRPHLAVLDRFLHLASFAERHPGVIAQWDADVWFTRPIFDLFDHYDAQHSGRLVCNLERVFQQSCYSPARQDPEIEQQIRNVLEPIVAEHGNVLHCGFIAGASPIIARYCRYLERLITEVAFHPEWASDVVGLNHFYHHRHDAISIVDQRYNCLPDWLPDRQGDQFFWQGRPMQVIHVTSPWRKSENGDRFRFQHVHPELYQLWRARLG